MDTKYRNDIGLADKYRFGIEIEFSDANIGLLYKELKENNPVKFKLYHKHIGCNFDFNNYWCLDQDSSVTNYIKTKNGEVLLGGELSSKILIDKEFYWKELKDICEILRKNNCNINELCSCHINIDAKEFVDNRNFYEVFSKLIALYENDLILFYMGDRYLRRKTLEEYAKPIKYSLMSKVNEIDFQSDDRFLHKLLYMKHNTFMLYHGINIQDIKLKKMIEIRYPNGTLNEKTIQNNINFSLKLIDAILNDKFDRERLAYLVNEEIKDRWTFTNTSDYDYENFYNLVETISTSASDINDMMGQYEKVLRTKH